jgi:hypothetical protein
MRMPTYTDLAPVVARLAALAALTAIAGPSFADGDSVTFVENVRCKAGVCEAQRKTVPVVETVRAKDAGSADFCVEFTRRLTGFKTFPSLDPAVQIQIPQFEEGEKRYFRCAPAGSMVSTR